MSDLTPQAYIQSLTDDQLDECFRECLEHQARIDGQVVPVDEYRKVVAIHHLCVAEYGRRSAAEGTAMSWDEIMTELEAEEG